MVSRVKHHNVRLNFTHVLMRLIDECNGQASNFRAMVWLAVSKRSFVGYASNWLRSPLER